MNRQRTHVLVVEMDGEYDHQHRFECPGVDDSCRAWDECMVEHSEADHERVMEDEQAELHGVAHAYISGFGLCTVSNRCWLRVTDSSDSVDGIKPGRYRFDWSIEDDEWLVLDNVTPEASR